jgi:hypothetical protein
MAWGESNKAFLPLIQYPKFCTFEMTTFLIPFCQEKEWRL